MNAVLVRFLRIAVSTALGVLAAQYGNEKWYIALTPLLAALGKFLRDMFPGKVEWLPI